MRTRIYSVNGTRIYSAFDSGSINSGHTYFSNFPEKTGGHEICEALVETFDHAHVDYGPVCETI
jgi:hypothetical protein